MFIKGDIREICLPRLKQWPWRLQSVQLWSAPPHFQCFDKGMQPCIKAGQDEVPMRCDKRMHPFTNGKG